MRALTRIFKWNGRSEPGRKTENEMKHTWSALGAAALAMACMGSSALAQETLEPRLRKLESEVNALQRKVFSSGGDKYFEPEITQTPKQAQLPGAASNGAVSDLILRVDALEQQLAGLTAQTEENAYKMGQFEDRLTKLEAAAAPPAGLAPPSQLPAVGNVSAAGRPTSAAAVTAAAAEPTAARIAAVQAIEKPDTGDAGEDEYIYGYRLWDAKFFPEAQQQLKRVVDTYPGHKRASFARNLLGRAYLDDGKAAAAAQVFLENYQKLPRGERAPDSLYFLAEALIDTKSTEKACAALAELKDAYPDVASGRLSNRVQSASAAAKCAG